MIESRLVLSVIHIICFVSSVQNANITILCSESHPIDAGTHFFQTTRFIKGSQVWYYPWSSVNKIEGPFELKDVYPKIDVNSIDAAFHVIPDPNITDNATKSMSWMAFLFKDQNYYIYILRIDGYKFYDNTTGVPFKLKPGKGAINMFSKSIKGPIDAIVFDRIKYEALFLVDTTVFVVSSFEKWTNSAPNVVQKNISDIFGITEKVDAALDFTDRVMLIFGQNYCDFKWSVRKCNKQSLRTFFNCTASDIIEMPTETVPIITTPVMTTTQLDSNSDSIDSTQRTSIWSSTLPTQSGGNGGNETNRPSDSDTGSDRDGTEEENESRKDSSGNDGTAIILIILIVLVTLIVLISLGLVLFFTVFKPLGTDTTPADSTGSTQSSMLS